MFVSVSDTVYIKGITCKCLVRLDVMTVYNQCITVLRRGK